MESAAEPSVTDNPDARRYEARLGDELVGYAEYVPLAGRLIFTHTVVEPEHEGRGIGSRLARSALDDVRARGLRATVHCPFITAYVARHTEYSDIVDLPRGNSQTTTGG